MLFNASILHDVGLAAAHEDESSRADFAVVGARVAHRFALDQGVDEGRARRIYEAISLHLNPVVDARRDGIEAHLLALGAGLDFLGLGSHRMRRDVAQAGHERHPRAVNAAGLLPDIAHPAWCRPAVLRPLAARLSAQPTRQVAMGPVTAGGGCIAQSVSIAGLDRLASLGLPSGGRRDQQARRSADVMCSAGDV